MPLFPSSENELSSPPFFLLFRAKKFFFLSFLDQILTFSSPYPVGRNHFFSFFPLLSPHISSLFPPPPGSDFSFFPFPPDDLSPSLLLLHAPPPGRAGVQLVEKATPSFFSPLSQGKPPLPDSQVDVRASCSPFPTVWSLSSFFSFSIPFFSFFRERKLPSRSPQEPPPPFLQSREIASLFWADGEDFRCLFALQNLERTLPPFFPSSSLPFSFFPFSSPFPPKQRRPPTPCAALPLFFFYAPLFPLSFCRREHSLGFFWELLADQIFLSPSFFLSSFFRLWERFFSSPPFSPFFIPLRKKAICLSFSSFPSMKRPPPPPPQNTPVFPPPPITPSRDKHDVVPFPFFLLPEETPFPLSLSSDRLLVFSPLTFLQPPPYHLPSSGMRNPAPPKTGLTSGDSSREHCLPSDEEEPSSLSFSSLSGWEHRPSFLSKVFSQEGKSLFPLPPPFPGRRPSFSVHEAVNKPLPSLPDCKESESPSSLFPLPFPEESRGLSFSPFPSSE